MARPRILLGTLLHSTRPRSSWAKAVATKKEERRSRTAARRPRPWQTMASKECLPGVEVLSLGSKSLLSFSPVDASGNARGSCKNHELLIAEGINGIQARGARSGVETCSEADQDGKGDGSEDQP